MSASKSQYFVRPATESDIPSIIEMCLAVYPESPSWSAEQLVSHQRVFPEGQMVAIDTKGAIVGMAASLIVFWDDYEWDTSWRDFTGGLLFKNHDPKKGRTLYGAEIMVHPKMQGKGVGAAIYQARADLVRRLQLLRIRAGARLQGYHRYAAHMSAAEYVLKVVKGEIKDLTLSFQLKHGFQVLKVVQGYLRHDPMSLGFAAVIEWINKTVARPEDYDAVQKSRYYRIFIE